MSTHRPGLSFFLTTSTNTTLPLLIHTYMHSRMATSADTAWQLSLVICQAVSAVAAMREPKIHTHIHAYTHTHIHIHT